MTSRPFADAAPTKQRLAWRVQPVLPITCRSSRQSSRLVERSAMRLRLPASGWMTAVRVERMSRMPGVCSAWRRISAMSRAVE